MPSEVMLFDCQYRHSPAKRLTSIGVLWRGSYSPFSPDLNFFVSGCPEQYKIIKGRLQISAMSDYTFGADRATQIFGISGLPCFGFGIMVLVLLREKGTAFQQPA